MATAPVGCRLIQIEAIEPPRSWTKEEKLFFAGSPRDIQGAVARRERDKEKAMRKAQNEVGDLRNELTRLKLKDGANTKPVES